MKCPKCSGRMYTEKFYDFVKTHHSWKCTSCGEMLDGVIVSNRAMHSNLILG